MLLILMIFAGAIAYWLQKIIFRKNYAKGVKKSGKAYYLSFSIGYAMWSETQDMEVLVSRADERMYEEKVKKKKLGQ